MVTKTNKNHTRTQLNPWYFSLWWLCRWLQHYCQMNAIIIVYLPKLLYYYRLGKINTFIANFFFDFVFFSFFHICYKRARKREKKKTHQNILSFPFKRFHFIRYAEEINSNPFDMRMLKNRRWNVLVFICMWIFWEFCVGSVTIIITFGTFFLNEDFIGIVHNF